MAKIEVKLLKEHYIKDRLVEAGSRIFINEDEIGMHMVRVDGKVNPRKAMANGRPDYRTVPAAQAMAAALVPARAAPSEDPTTSTVTAREAARTVKTPVSRPLSRTALGAPRGFVPVDPNDPALNGSIAEAEGGATQESEADVEDVGGAGPEYGTTMPETAEEAEERERLEREEEEAFAAEQAAAGITKDTPMPKDGEEEDSSTDSSAERSSASLSDEDKATRINDALNSLDPDKDQDWTQGGKPSVDAVSKLAGFTVSRNEINKAAPEFERPKD